MKTMHIEQILQWALREELPKGRPVEASPWDTIQRFGELGCRVQTSGPVSGLGFVPGEPHPDAAAVGAAVAALPRAMQLAADQCRDLLGHWSALDPLAIDAVMRATFNPQALVIRCAVLGQTMEWDCGTPRFELVRRDGRRWAIVFCDDGAGGVVEARDARGHRYSLAAAPRCLGEWVEPTIGQMLEMRAEYFVWHGALVMLAARLAHPALSEHRVLPPRVAAWPWLTGQPPASRVLPAAGAAVELVKLPLKPRRKVASPPLESEIERQARMHRQGRRGCRSAETVMAPA